MTRIVNLLLKITALKIFEKAQGEIVEKYRKPETLLKLNVFLSGHTTSSECSQNIYITSLDII